MPCVRLSERLSLFCNGVGGSSRSSLRAIVCHQNHSQRRIRSHHLDCTLSGRAGEQDLYLVPTAERLVGFYLSPDRRSWGVFREVLFELNPKVDMAAADGEAPTEELEEVNEVAQEPWTLREQIDANSVIAPELPSWNDWQRWRSRESAARCYLQRRDGLTVWNKHEVELWRKTMLRLHCEHWRRQLEEREYAIAAAATEEAQEGRDVQPGGTHDDPLPPADADKTASPRMDRAGEESPRSQTTGGLVREQIP